MSTETDVPVKKDKLIIFDTTLRDGEQSPGATLNIEEKLEIARQLSLVLKGQGLVIHVLQGFHVIVLQ